MLIGEVRYNMRHMRLNKKTGLREPVKNEDGKHMISQRPELRIVDDETFTEAQEKLKSRSPEHDGCSHTSMGRAFTGRLICGVCGSVFYSKKSKNEKGEYHYYNCGLRQRKGPLACSNASSVREDQLVKVIDQVTQSIFNDADKLISMTLNEAQRLMEDNHSRIRDFRNKINVIEKEIRELTRLIMDPEIGIDAKRAISRQMGEKEAARTTYDNTITHLSSADHQNSERLVTEVRKSLEKARNNFANMTDPQVLNRFIEDFIGPITVSADGSLTSTPTPTKSAPADAEAEVPAYIAGGGFEPPTSGL